MKSKIENLKCPLSTREDKYLYSGKELSFFLRIYNFINYFFLAKLGKIWLPQYVFPIYPGIVSHFSKNLRKYFYQETVLNGEQTSIFFEKIGIKEFANKNGGICTFRMGSKIAIYQTSNLPLINDGNLSPSTGPNRKLFGDFMGTLSIDNSLRKEKRLPLLKKLANSASINELIPSIKNNAKNYLKDCLNQELNLETFIIEMVADIDSHLPGVVDLKEKSLASYLRSNEYGKVIRNFFELASDVISKMNTDALELTESIVPFVKDLLKENFISIKNSPESNIIKQYFILEKIQFNHENIDLLTDSFLKELGTILVALYDTSSLSLYWLICYIERNGKIKNRVIDESKNDLDINKISFIEMVVIEAIRLAGNNPTALWREVIKPAEITINGINILVRAGTMLWLDRMAANRSENTFSWPDDFYPENIEGIFHKENETVFSLLGHNRYEINSFSMINTFNNPRKCPGRFFSVFLQSCLIREIYGQYEVFTENTEIDLRKHCSMPRPQNNAKILLRPLKGDKND